MAGDNAQQLHNVGVACCLQDGQLPHTALLYCWFNCIYRCHVLPLTLPYCRLCCIDTPVWSVARDDAQQLHNVGVACRLQDGHAADTCFPTTPLLQPLYYTKISPVWPVASDHSQQLHNVGVACCLQDGQLPHTGDVLLCSATYRFIC
jgi:hypothetical protein